jgi:hypothetical protein
MLQYTDNLQKRRLMCLEMYKIWKAAKLYFFGAGGQNHNGRPLTENMNFKISQLFIEFSCIDSGI